MFRFTIRTLLILIAVVAAFLAGRVSYQGQINALRQQSEFQEQEIKELQQQRLWLRRVNEKALEADRLKESFRKLREPQEAEPGVYFLGPVND